MHTAQISYVVQVVYARYACASTLRVYFEYLLTSTQARLRMSKLSLACTTAFTIKAGEHWAEVCIRHANNIAIHS
eukprot:14276-Heterococcus_DN1.PRE.4